MGMGTIQRRVKTGDLPEGTRVSKPITTWACWAVTTEFHGHPLKAPRNCAARARGGRLCCQAHRSRESEAVALKASLEADDG